MRSKRTNGEKPIRTSKFPRQHVNLRPGEEAVVCRLCTREMRLLGTGTTRKVRPHRAQDTDHGRHAPRCDGSDQLIIVDLTLEEWQRRQAEAAADAKSRKPTSVRRKPKLPTTPPAPEVRPSPISAESARQTYTTHRARCAACTGRRHCTDGERLADTYLRLLRQEPRRRPAREAGVRERERFERKRTSRKPANRAAAEWKSVLPAVEQTDTQRAQQATGATSTAKGPDLPLEPLHINR